MSNLKHDILTTSVKMINLLIQAALFGAVWMLYYVEQMNDPYHFRGNAVVILLFFLFYCVFGKIYDAFRISLSRISEIVYSQTLATLISDFFMYLITVLLMKRLPNPLPLLATAVVQILASVVWAFFAHRWYFRTFPAIKTAIIYDLRQGMEKLVSEYGLNKKFDVQFTAGVQECLDDLDMLNRVDTVFLSGIHSHDRNIILKYCMYNGIDVYVIPRIGDVIMSGAKGMHMFHLPMLQVRRFRPSPFYLGFKRFFDIVISACGILVLSPIFCATSIAIKATDGGPVFYKQKRLTKNGRVFEVLKFRSMRVDAEKDGVARLSSGENDDRITPVGRVIRACRVDELPQLVNILRGDMSVCGPRPERPEIAAQYEEEMPEFSLRLQAKAGLTGYAQVYGKYNTTPYDKLQMDLMYIARPSIAEDLKIIFATVKILFMPESTEGVAEGQVTAMGVTEPTAEVESPQDAQDAVAGLK